MKLKLLLFISIFLSINLIAQRNTILIIADDLSTDYFGFYEDHVDTVDVPNIRALLKKGVRFTNATSNPVCSSTRSGILTGRYSFRTGVGGIVGGAGGSNTLDTAEITIPKLLKIYNPNIAKADIGKWHLHNPTPASNLLNPLKMGYDHFEGPFIGQLPSFTNWTKYTDGIPSTVTTYATTENVNNAVTWLRAQNNKPFFLWLAFNAPHEPLHLPPAGLHTYTTLSGTPFDIKNNPKLYFKAMIQALDHEIGRLFDSLRVMNKFDSTDIIFIGDNGNTPRTAQIADTSRAKGTIYQYGVHVPFIISGPDIINPNRKSDALVNTADIFATVLELMGYTNWATQIPSNKPVDSKSIVPLLKNQSTTIRPWALCEIFKLIPDSDEGKAMRNMDYKLIKFNYGKEEFYKLANDPLETINLLKSTMSATDSSNYLYLCNQMTTLIGSGNYCQSGVGISNPIQTSKIQISPNPFTDKINITGLPKETSITMTNTLGQIIYKGNDISSQDFTALPEGLYFLSAGKGVFVKVVKRF